MAPSFRIYFRGPEGVILGRDDFEAEDDRAAMAIAAALGRTCSDVCSRVELWQGSRRVEAAVPAPAMAAAERLTAAMLDALEQVEDRLRDSGWAVAKSRRLIEETRRRTERRR